MLRYEREIEELLAELEARQGGMHQGGVRLQSLALQALPLEEDYARHRGLPPAVWIWCLGLVAALTILVAGLLVSGILQLVLVALSASVLAILGARPLGWAVQRETRSTAIVAAIHRRKR